jgi:hypothetical protein
VPLSLRWLALRQTKFHAGVARNARRWPGAFARGFPAGWGRARRLLAHGLAVVLALGLTGLLGLPMATAQPLELVQLDVLNTEQGLLIDFDTRFELPTGVEEALQKGVALHFAAEARVLEKRWYWRDRRVALAQRTWRIAYQPLTFSYRVNFGGLGQTYPTLAEALRTVQRSTSWRVADPIAAGDTGRYYVEFSYWLDRDQLPRPLQIGVSSSPEWNLQVERSVLVAPR